jgi:hypothetical protein
LKPHENRHLYFFFLPFFFCSAASLITLPTCSMLACLLTERLVRVFVKWVCLWVCVWERVGCWVAAADSWEFGKVLCVPAFHE